MTKRVRPMHEADVVIGKNIATMRVLAGLTQTEVAEAMDPPITYQQIYKYERGIDRISASRLVDLARVCGCRIAHFYVGVADVLEDVGAFAETISKEEGTIIRSYRRVRPELQSIIKNLIAGIIKETAHNMMEKRHGKSS